MSTREFTWTPLSFINDAADKLGFGQLFSHVLIHYFVLLFLHLLVSFFFVFFFHPVLAWRSQKLSIAIVAKHVFFSCFGMSEKEVTFFPFNVTILGSKKDTSCWNTPICSDIVLDMWFCCFHAVLACPIKNISGWNLQIHFSTKGFTLAQKITWDPHISKESDIHHSQNNEDTFEKLFAKKTCNSKNPKETNMEKDCVFSLNCWKYSLVKENKVSNKTVFRLFG